MSNIGNCGFNNLGNRQSVWNSRQWQNTDTIRPFTNGGMVTVIDGASSALALETGVTGASPVRVDTSFPTSLNQTLVAVSSTEATWQDIGVTDGPPIEGASFITVDNSGGGLTANKIASNGGGIFVSTTVGPNQITFEAENLGDSGTYEHAQLDVDTFRRSNNPVAQPLNNWQVVNPFPISSTGILPTSIFRLSYYIYRDTAIINIFFSFTKDNTADEVSFVAFMPTEITVSSLGQNGVQALHTNPISIFDDATGDFIGDAIAYSNPDTNQIILAEGNSPSILTQTASFVFKGQIYICVIPT